MPYSVLTIRIRFVAILPVAAAAPKVDVTSRRNLKFYFVPCAAIIDSEVPCLHSRVHYGDLISLVEVPSNEFSRVPPCNEIREVGGPAPIFVLLIAVHS